MGGCRGGTKCVAEVASPDGPEVIGWAFLVGPQDGRGGSGVSAIHCHWANGGGCSKKSKDNRVTNLLSTTTTNRILVVEHCLMEMLTLLSPIQISEEIL